MRHARKSITLSIAALMLVALPVLADDATWGGVATQSDMREPGQQNGKVECMLVAQNNCALEGVPDSRIDSIRHEIDKGSAVYTNEELQILNNELDKAINDRFDAYLGGG
ncbi:MAG: hypothetical protein P4L44_05325 [Oryzomonas sp.]|uniref:hypothetical protein n=1 Tax=Oryzomonas sp. TaxID=2855186 RepID=UPI0028518ACC|nr:hypothetical protein [Oryzomonas sp.]MDR3579362.1 hypothetical protein [Oryzomonas sp.]